jgi:IPT/TIG domain
MAEGKDVKRANIADHRRHVAIAIAVGSLLSLLTSLGSADASLPVRQEVRVASGTAISSTGYLTLMIGRALYSKATSTCQTPAGMLTLDQLVPQLYAGNITNEPVTRPGITLTANVIPDRTLPTTTKCLSQNLYPSWSDLSNLSHSNGMAVVSASQSYSNMTTLTTQQQIQQSCGSLTPLISNGFHRAWGLFAYPDNHYTTTVQTAVVDNCFAFGRTYVKPSATNATNQESATTTPWLQKTVDIGGGRCHISTLPCSRYHSSSLGLYTSPLTLAGLTNVAPGNWTALQTYTFVTGASTSGIQWDCTNSNWKAHWTSLFEVYCWNDYLYALSQIPSNVVITDPATVAEAWGRLPTPYVAVSSTSPSTLTAASQSTTISWSSWENGSYAAEVGGADCSTGAVVSTGAYSVAPATTTLTLTGGDFSPGSNTVRICMTNDAGHVGSATTAVSYLAPPSVASIAPAAGPLAGGTQISITGNNFTSDATVSVDGYAATSVVWASYTSMTAVVPSAPNGTAGSWDVIVTEAAGTSSASSNDLFQYEGTPTVTSLSPATGPSGGGTLVTITGTYFYQDSLLAVSFGGSAGTNATVTSPTTITVLAPAGTPLSTVDVQLTDAGGTSATSSGDQYVYGL